MDDLLNVIIHGFLAPSDLVYKMIASTKIWDLRATPSWREPPPESLSRYISPLEEYHSDTDAFGASYGVIGLWSQLLVDLAILYTTRRHDTNTTRI